MAAPPRPTPGDHPMTQPLLADAPRRVALYARYSTDMQNPTSVEDQFRQAERYAKRQGWVIVERFSDSAISGTAEPRPGGLPAAHGGARVARRPASTSSSPSPSTASPGTPNTWPGSTSSPPAPGSRSTPWAAARPTRCRVGLVLDDEHHVPRGALPQGAPRDRGQGAVGPERRRPDLRLQPRHRRARRAGKGRARNRRDRGRGRAAHLPRLRRGRLADRDRQPT